MAEKMALYGFHLFLMQSDGMFTRSLSGTHFLTAK